MKTHEYIILYSYIRKNVIVWSLHLLIFFHFEFFDLDLSSTYIVQK